MRGRALLRVLHDMTEADYINAGARLERARTPAAIAAARQCIAQLLAAAADRAEALRLIERGRADAR